MGMEHRPVEWKQQSSPLPYGARSHAASVVMTTSLVTSSSSATPTLTRSTSTGTTATGSGSTAISQWLITGGYSDEGYQSSKQVIVYDLAFGAPSSTGYPPMNHARALHAAVVWNGSLFVFGGNVRIPNDKQRGGQYQMQWGNIYYFSSYPIENA
jgi:hypothetical protein